MIDEDEYLGPTWDGPDDDDPTGDDPDPTDPFDVPVKPDIGGSD